MNDLVETLGSLRFAPTREHLHRLAFLAEVGKRKRQKEALRLVELDRVRQRVEDQAWQDKWQRQICQIRKTNG